MSKHRQMTYSRDFLFKKPLHYLYYVCDGEEVKRFTKPTYTFLVLIVIMVTLVFIAYKSQTGIESYADSSQHAAIEAIVREATNRMSKMSDVPRGEAANDDGNRIGPG